MLRNAVCFVFLTVLLLSPSAVSAAPITFTVNGVVNFDGPIPNPFVAVGDPFSMAVTYDPSSPVAIDAGFDRYYDAVISMDVTIQSSQGAVHYSAAGLSSPTTTNFAVVGPLWMSFNISDSEEDGTAGSVQGPEFSVSGVTYTPWSIYLEIAGSFADALSANALPTAPFWENSSRLQMGVGYLNQRDPQGQQQANIVGRELTAPVPVPEPASIVLLSSGLAGVVARAWRRRAE